MNITNRFEELRFLSQTNRLLHKQRQALEFRVVTLTLTLFVIGAFAVLKDDIATKTELTPIIIWCLFLLIAFFAIAYLHSIHEANRINIKLAEQAEDEIIRMLHCDALTEMLNMAIDKRIHVSPYWSWGWQAAVIILVANSCAYLILQSS